MDEHTFSAVVLAVMMSVVLSPTLLRLHLSRSSKTASCRALFCPFAPLPLCTPSTRPPNALRTSSSHPAPRTPPPYSAGHRAGRARHRAAADECAAHLGRARRLRLLPAAGAPRSSHTHAHTHMHAQCTQTCMHTRTHMHMHTHAHTHAYYLCAPAADRLRAVVGSQRQAAFCGSWRRPRRARLPLAPPRGPAPRLQPVGGQRDLPRRQAPVDRSIYNNQPTINLYLSIAVYDVYTLLMTGSCARHRRCISRTRSSRTSTRASAR